MDFNVNGSITLRADEALLALGNRLIDALQSNKVAPEVKTTVTPVTPVKDTSNLNDAQAVEILGTVETTQNEYPSVKVDDYQEYEQFKHMEAAVDKLKKKDETSATALLQRFTTDGTPISNHVPPNCWGKVIAEATDLFEKVNKPTKTYKLEDVRALARKVQMEKGKDVLSAVFKSFDKSKLSEFLSSEYASLYDKLQEVA